MNNPAITNIAISLGAMQLSKRLPMEDPEFITKLRIGYVASQLIAVGIYFYIMMRIRQKNDLTVLKYVAPASAMNPDAQPELVTTTVKDYDLSETSKSMRGLLVGIAFMGFLHGYMKYTQPLLVQSLMSLKGVFEANEARIHILGKKAEGDLSRPFKTAPGLMDQLQGKASGPQTDAASIKAAERAGGSKKTQ